MSPHGGALGLCVGVAAADPLSLSPERDEIPAGDAAGTSGDQDREQRDDATPTMTASRGSWVALTLSDGSRRVCRFVRAGAKLVAFDHGSYGRNRSDFYVRPEAIVSMEPAARPPLLLTFVDPLGVLCRVGRFETRAEAEQAIEPVRHLIRDIRIEARP